MTAGLLAAVALLLQAVVSAAQSDPSKVAPEAVQRAADEGRVDVFVLLHEPARTRPGDYFTRRRRVRSQRNQVLSKIRPEHLWVRHALSLVSGFTASVTPAGLAELAAHPEVERIDPLAYGSGALAESVPQIRADMVHRRDDLGQQVTVAILDTGIAPSHPDLQGSIVAEECFCSGNCCPDGTSRQSGPGSALTQFVHGIHVAGIIVSKGIVAGPGVAPGAQVVSVKVLNDDNRGSLTDWVDALEWIAENRPDVQAINMSLVSDALYRGDCDSADSFTRAFGRIIDVLRARGTLTFVASGNDADPSSMAAPACVHGAMAVGAVTKRDRIAAFSNSGTALDLLAPGAGIVSTGPNGTSAVLSGTSMAAPHATGTAALMLALNPSISADALASILESTGVPINDTRNGLVRPRLNALSAMNAVLAVTSPLLGGGSKRSDCLLTWLFAPQGITTTQPVPGAICHDNDPACDADQTTGQCTFQLSLCFNAADRRLPYCDAGEAIGAATIIWPNPARPRGAFDVVNADALQSALPTFPIAGSQCSGMIPFVVPTAENGGKQWIRLAARSSERIDTDRIRLTCLPATP